MGDRFLDSTNGGAATPFETWDTAATTLAAILTDGTNPLLAGEKIYVNAAHTEDPGGDVFYTFPGTDAAPNIVMTVDMTGDPEPPVSGDYLKATATTINNDATEVDINFAGGDVKFFGLDFRIGDDAQVNTLGTILFDDCIIGFGRTNNSEFFIGGSGGAQKIIFKNTEVIFIGASQFHPSGRVLDLDWILGKITGPTGSIFTNITRDCNIRFSGVDLSSPTGDIVNLAGASVIKFEAHHCLFNSSLGLATGTIAHSASRVFMSGCDDTTGNKLYRMEYETFYGTVEEEIAIVVSSGGASDGTTPISWKMSNNGNTELFYEPLVSPPINVWVDSTGSKTFTVQCNWGAGTPDTDQVWLEVEHLDTAADTQSAFTNNGPTDLLDVGTAITTVTGVSWDGSLASEDPFSLVVTATVNRVGPAICRVYFAEPSGGAGADILYVDPKVTVAAA